MYVCVCLCVPWTEKPGNLQSTGCEKLDSTERLSLSILVQLGFSCCVYVQVSVYVSVC